MIMAVRDQPSEFGTTPMPQPVDSSLPVDTLDGYAACFCCSNPFEDYAEVFSIQGQAFDTIVVQSASTGRVASSSFLINFDHPVTPFPPSPYHNGTTDIQALLEIVDDSLGKVYFPIEHDPVEKKNKLRHPPQCDNMSRSASMTQQQQQEGDDKKQSSESDDEAAVEQGTLRLLAKLLKPGKNHVRYLFSSERRVLGVAVASIFLWSDRDRLIVCDVDGTITKTNVRGIYDTLLTEKYAHCHDRVCEFLSNLQKSGAVQEDENPQEQSVAGDPPNVNVLYLTSRPWVIAENTRKFLANLRQSPDGEDLPMKRRRSSKSYNASSLRNVKGSVELTLEAAAASQSTQTAQHHHRLPEGPLIGFPGRLSEVLKMELVTHDVHLFKAATLMDQVVTPFCKVSDDPQAMHQRLFVAGFGNTLMDVAAYDMAGLHLSQIYLIDKKSRISCLDGQHHQPLLQEKAAGLFRRKSSLLDGDSSSGMEDSSSPPPAAAAEGANNNNKNRLPVLKAAMNRKLYKRHVGTVFVGYHDENIVSHVCLRGKLW